MALSHLYVRKKSSLLISQLEKSSSVQSTITIHNYIILSDPDYVTWLEASAKVLAAPQAVPLHESLVSCPRYLILLSVNWPSRSVWSRCMTSTWHSCVLLVLLIPVFLPAGKYVVFFKKIPVTSPTNDVAVLFSSFTVARCLLTSLNTLDNTKMQPQNSFPMTA